MDRIRQLKPYLKWVLRIVGTGVFLWLFLRTASIHEVLRQINRMSILEYGVLFLIFLFIQFLASIRWKLLLAASGIKESVRELFVSVLYGQTINQVLPSSIGGDSARIAYLMSRHPRQKSESLSSTFLDRFLGFFALLLIVFINFPFLEEFSLARKVSVSCILGAFLVLVLLSFAGALDAPVEWIFNREVIPTPVRRLIHRYWDIFLGFRLQKKRVLFAFLLSLSAQVFTIFSHYITFRLLDIDVSLFKLFIVFPVVFIIVALPISIGGVGVREVALASMLGISSHEVLSFSVIRYSYFILLPVLLFLFSMVREIRKGKG